MDLLYLTFSVCVLCIIFILSLRYLSLLRWFSGQAYVLSKKQESFTILEVLELFKNAKPFPVSYQKGWKIHSFIHGHRVWFHFLTFTRVSTSVLSSAPSAPCIKVFATFDRVRTSAQSLLQLVKDTSLSCEWKPGVIAARSVHEVPASEVNGRGKGMASLPVLNDFVRVECVQPTKYHWPWRGSSANVTPTIIEDYKRYWHREDNGCSWLLQMNEEAQSLVFFLIQPVEDPDHSLLTVVTWSAPHAAPIIPADEAPSILLSSLSDYIHLRRVQMTPLLHISLPLHMADGAPSPHPKLGSPKKTQQSSPSEGSVMARFRQYWDRRGTNSSPGRPDLNSKQAALSETIRKSASILRYRGQGGAGLLARGGLESDASQIIREEENESESESADSASQASGADQGDGADGQCGDGLGGGRPFENGGKDKRKVLRRAVSEGGPRLLASASQPDIAMDMSEDAQKSIARYKTLVNQAAADIMAEALRVSNIDLETSTSVQADVSNGWTFQSFESNIVVLKKVVQPKSTVQSYIGKGFILAPPKTVWDAVRNPRTRFTYDDTLKKVDIVEQITQGIKIVYLYQEMVQLLRKECGDLVCLQGERVEGSKYILAYTSVDHPKVPITENIVRGQMLSSGWIVEPVRKDTKLYSLVTYVMQVDYGAVRTGSDRPLLEEMMSKAPLSICYLQQYLKPAVQLARRKSAPVIPV